MAVIFTSAARRSGEELCRSIRGRESTSEVTAATWSAPGGPFLRGRLPVCRWPGIGRDRSSFRPGVADRPDLRTQVHRRRRHRTHRASIPAAKLDRARAYAEAARGRELDRLRKAPKHQRNDTLNKAAFKLGQLLPYGLFDTVAVTDDLARAARDRPRRGDRPDHKSGLNAGSGIPGVCRS